jgi:hypothetical protein
VNWFDPTKWKDPADLVTDWKTIGSALLLVFGAIGSLWRWGLPLLRRIGQRRMATWQIIALIGGTWLLVTMALGALAWAVATSRPAEVSNNPPSTGSIATVSQEQGPLTWFTGLVLEGPLPFNVFSVRFKGVNSSQREVRIKSAEIISAINGTQLKMEIIAEAEIVPLDQIELIPAGAPIELVAKLGPPDPAHPGKVLGLDAKTFLETWRQFSFNVEDDARKYRISYNEANVAPFFPGLVGPHVSKKAVQVAQ